MPPEQLRGERVDARADIFSVGVILAEAALGHRFWGKATGPMVASKLGQGELPSLDEPQVPAELREICHRALAPERERRYPTAAAFKADLVDYLGRLGGPVAREELAALCCELIAEDRARLQTIVDEQLTRVDPRMQTLVPDARRAARNSSVGDAVAEPDALLADDATRPGGPAAPATPSPPARAMSLASSEDSQRGPTPPVATFTIAPSPIQFNQPTPPPPSPPPVLPSLRPRVPAAVWIAAASIIGTLVIVWVVRATATAPPPGPHAATAPSVAAVAPQVSPDPRDPAVPHAPAASPVRIEIIVSPPDATMLLDGKPLPINPYVGSLPRDTQIHDLVVEAPGYRSIRRQFALDRDLMLQLSLPPAKAAVTNAPRRPAAPPSVPRPRAAVAARPAAEPPTAPASPASPPPSPPPAARPEDPRRTIDDDIYDKTAKRKLDSDVFDDEQPAKPPIDRDSPWKN